MGNIVDIILAIIAICAIVGVFTAVAVFGFAIVSFAITAGIKLALMLF